MGGSLISQYIKVLPQKEGEAMIEQMTAGLFAKAALDSRRCIRCSKLVPRLSIFTKSEEPAEGNYALIAQLLNNNHLRGGILCVRCVTSFTEWMSKEDE